MTSEDAWAQARDEMELSRRDFINAARREVVDIRTSVEDVPVARPALSEIRELFGSTSPHTALSQDAHDEALGELCGLITARRVDHERASAADMRLSKTVRNRRGRPPCCPPRTCSSTCTR